MNEFILYCSLFALSLCHTKRKSMKRFIHIILTLTAIAIACTAEMQAQNDMITVRYSTDDGLPSNTVYTTLKSKDGFMWFGTWYGLSSFDGTEFTPYVIRRNQKSDIPPRKVINMVEDRRNNIWIRTTDNRLYRFDKTTERFNDMYSELKRVAPNLRVIKVQTMDNGNTLLYTRDKSLYEVYTDKNNAPVIKLIYNARHDIDRATLRLKHNVIGETARYIFWLGPNYEVSTVSKGRNTIGKKILGNLTKIQNATCFNTAYGKVFIGNDKGLVSCIDINNGRKFTLCPAAGEKITTITPIGKNIYISTGNAIYRSTKRIATVNTQAETSFTDKYGMLWLYGMNGGLTLFNPKNNAVRQFPTPQGTALNSVKFCDAGTNGLFILLRNGKVWQYNRNTSSMSELNPLGKEDSFELPVHHITPAIKQDVKFNDIDLDSNGLLWLSSINNGVYKIRFPQKLYSYLYAPLLANDVSSTDNSYGIRSLFQSRDGSLWIGTRRGNLYCIDPKTGKTKRTVSGIHGNVYNIMEDTAGNLWLASKGGGLMKVAPSNKVDRSTTVTEYRHNPNDRYSISDDKVYYTFQDSHHRIWVCTYGGGLNLMVERNGKTVFINKNNELKSYPGNDLYQSVRQIVEDKNHTLWVATTDGLLAFDADFKSASKIRFNNFRQNNNTTVVDNDIYSLLKDSRGNIWISIFGCGLNKVAFYNENTGRIKLTPLTANNQQSNIVSTVTEDKNHRLWFTSENGLSCIDEDNGNIHTYGFLDGFLRSKIEDNTSISLNDGRMLIGCREGIIAFSPDKVEKANNYPTPTFIVDFKVLNRSLDSFEPSICDVSPRYAKEITLRHNQNMFSIEFATLCFNGKKNITYTYILDGYEERWHTGDNSRVASYANVPPGEYTFRVKSADGNSPERTLRITILPPWWATWWAYTIYFLLFCGALYGGIRIALTMLRMRNEVYINNRLAELKIRFFTNISHELRTPLTLIQGPISSLRRDEKLSATGKEYLQLIDRNANKMLHLVNQILDFRKVQNGKMPLHLSHADICEIVKVILDEYRMAATDRNIRLNVITPEDPLMAWCDAEKIGVIVNNMASNAFKYTQPGGNITVTISEDTGNKLCSIRVEDDGASIPEQQLETIFDRFSMADNATSSDTQQTGTGIGLSLSREYALMHHGKIWAENVAGGGAAFTVEFPTNKEVFDGDNTELLFDDNTAAAELPELSGSPQNSQNSQNSQSSQPSAPSENILLVEDNADLRRMLTLQLSRHYSVTAASDGIEALEKIKLTPPDLVITDLMMPRMDGAELLRRIRQDFAVSHVPVIILTAKNGDSEKTHLIAGGANAFITKPFSNEMLSARIRQLLQEQSTFQRKMLLKSQQAENTSTDAADEYEKHLARKDMEFIDNIRSVIEENMQNEDFNIDSIAETAGLSRSAFFKKLKSLTGLAPVDLVKKIRLSKAERLVATTDKSISEIAYSVGFKESSYFGKCFKKEFGMTPLEYRSMKVGKK